MTAKDELRLLAGILMRCIDVQKNRMGALMRVPMNTTGLPAWPLPLKKELLVKCAHKRGGSLPSRLRALVEMPAGGVEEAI